MSRHEGRFGDRSARREYLAHRLERAARFRRVLAADVGFERACGLYLIQGPRGRHPDGRGRPASRRALADALHRRPLSAPPTRARGRRH